MAKIKWSKDAIEDIKEIGKYIKQDSPYYARLFIDRLFEMAEHWKFFLKSAERFQSQMIPTSGNLSIKNIELFIK